MTSLNPLFTVERQLKETIHANMDVSDDEAYQRALSLMQKVGIPQPENRLKQFPHRFSGGMRQRVVIAMAISMKPKLIIADEPSTALDVTTQAKLLELLKKLVDEDQICLIMITHDLAVIAELANNIIIMKEGKVVEYGNTNILAKGLKNLLRLLLITYPKITQISFFLFLMKNMVF